MTCCPTLLERTDLVICGELNQQGDTFSESSQSVGNLSWEETVSSEGITTRWDAACVKRAGQMQGVMKREGGARRSEKEN